MLCTGQSLSVLPSDWDLLRLADIGRLQAYRRRRTAGFSPRGARLAPFPAWSYSYELPGMSALEPTPSTAQLRRRFACARPTWERNLLGSESHAKVPSLHFLHGRQATGAQTSHQHFVWSRPGCIILRFLTRLSHLFWNELGAITRR